MNPVDLEIAAFVLGPVETNSYVLCSGGAVAVVDPGLQPAPLLDFCESHDLICEQIWLTHGHCDHIGGVAAVREQFPDARISCSQADARLLADAQANMSQPFGMHITAPPADRFLEPGTAIPLGRTTWQVLDTSGHTPGGISFYCSEARVVLTGDALFDGSIGRTDIPQADTQRLLGNIHSQLLSLPDDTRVLSGHGPATTIGLQRQNNPFLARSWPTGRTGEVG